jgi:hypothetical protein
MVAKIFPITVNLKGCDNGPQSTTAASQIARCALENNLKRSISNPSALEARLEPFKAFTTNDDLILDSFGLFQYGTTPILILTLLFGPRVFTVNLLCLIQLYRSADVSFWVARIVRCRYVVVGSFLAIFTLTPYSNRPR